MANPFRDLYSRAGYSTQRVVNSPPFIRERIDKPVGVSSASCTSDGVGGPSTLFQDDRGPLVQSLTPKPVVNDINTRGEIETVGNIKNPKPVI